MKTSSPWKSRGSVNDTHGGVHRSYSLSPAFPSFRQQENVGAEDQQANDHGSDRRDQHGSRRDILGVFNQRVKIRRCDIRQKFKGRVEGFGRPNRHDGKNEPAPFGGGDAEDDASNHHGDRCACVNPRIVLGLEHGPDADEGKREASYATRELKWSRHGSL